MTDFKIPDEDARVLTEKIMPYFGLSRIRIETSDSKKTYPDIWIRTVGGIPEITVTAEWLRQSPQERQKRLVHEVLHLTGLQHNDSIGYTSKPDTDTLSKRVYDMIMRSNGAKPKMLRLSKNLVMRRRQSR